MCGIYGWSFARFAGIDPAKRAGLSVALAIFNEERGDESWGAFAWDGTKEATYRHADAARECPGHAVLGTKRLVMAHTRQSTTGKVSVENCHPFKVGKILLAHNGMIQGHDALNKQYDRSCTVDSQHLAYHLNEGRGFEDLHGYGAIEWMVDGEPGKVWLCRMRSGSLSVHGILHRGKQVGTAWSSDGEHLEQAIQMAGLESYDYEVKEGQIYYIDPKDGLLYYEPDHFLRLGEAVYSSYTWNRTNGKSSSYLMGGDDESWFTGRDWEKEYTGSFRGTSAYVPAVVDSTDGEKEDTEIKSVTLRDEPVAEQNLRLERKRVADKLGLTQVDSDLFVDADGSIVDLDDLDSVIMFESANVPTIDDDDAPADLTAFIHN